MRAGRLILTTCIVHPGYEKSGRRRRSIQLGLIAFRLPCCIVSPRPTARSRPHELYDGHLPIDANNGWIRRDRGCARYTIPTSGTRGKELQATRATHTERLLNNDLGRVRVVYPCWDTWLTRVVCGHAWRAKTTLQEAQALSQVWRSVLGEIWRSTAFSA